MKPADALQIGDTIRVWWGMGRATVVGFRSHDNGQDGWRVVDFADGHSMTVTWLDAFEVLQ